MYCVKCRRKTADAGQPQMTTARNGRHMKRAQCAQCGTVKTNFVKMNGSGVRPVGRGVRNVGGAVRPVGRGVRQVGRGEVLPEEMPVPSGLPISPTAY